MSNFPSKDLLSASTLSKGNIERILEIAESMTVYANKQQQSELLAGKVLAALFYEPSTRTRLSFETAMQRLGGRVITVTGMESSSLVKGETLYDTGKVVENFADIVAMRHPTPGSVAELAGAVQIPVINAGDGAGEHPTQALLDMFTIKKERGTIVGRTVHSLTYLLSHFKVNLILVSPERLKMPAEQLQHFKDQKIQCTETESLEEGLKHAQVVYMTRVQKERFDDETEYEKYKHFYILTRAMVEKYNAQMTVMHPLPRVGEISLDVDDLAGAAYFRQVKNGVALRMALLAIMLGKVQF
jgi:aspartate carbamoyltransferase catalytic subunit